MSNGKLTKPRVSFAAETVRPHHEMTSLSLEEKRFLLAVERGDVASVRRMVSDTSCLNINCVDPLGRSGLLMAIDNENLEMVELLIEHKVDTKDALLHAINEEYVEAVEVLLEHEEMYHRSGEPHSWEAVPSDTATFTSDINPLILAAHRDNYEIIKILLDRGAQLPSPHSCRCGCEECVVSHQEDSLRHSRSRINSYRALASPSLIALSSKDPVLQAFELSWELRRLSVLEYEFKTDYQELRRKCQDFATALLDHTRSSHELEVLLNHDPAGPAFEHGDRMSLSRLKLAIKYKQKKFVAHPNVQQLLASLWYEGLPGFRRKNMLLQFIEVVRIGILFPLFSFCYICAPHSSMGQSMRKPFIKFICHSASYLTFLVLLILASQRIESVVLDWFGVAHVASQWLATDVTTKRGAPPSIVEWLILAWVAGLIWSEIKQLWDMGLQEYISDLWNIIDFITNALYVATIALRIVAYQQVQKELTARTGTANLPRECWDAWDPMLIAEGLFGAANVFSSLKLVYIFSINPHLGPLQVTLSRMVLDIIKFAFLFVLTQFAFSCGLNQLLWYYADLEKQECFRLQCHGPNCLPRDKQPDACYVWRRFSNLFETIQTLFWAVFGLIDLDNFELAGAKPFTRFWGMFMFGSYSVINITVLLNLLIAMMNHSYQLISERADTEWKFARSKLWMSYFEEGGTVPPPFNIIVAPKSLIYLCRWVLKRCCGHSVAAKKQHLRTVRKKFRQASERDHRYQSIMRNLVRRYVTREQRKADNQGVTEDDVNEVKQDISAFRYELIEILKNSGMNTASANPGGGCGGRKNRLKERRLMKGFHLGSIQSFPSVPGSLGPFCSSRDSASAFNGLQSFSTVASPCSEHGDLLANSVVPCHSSNHSDRHSLVRRRWGSLLEAARNARVTRLLARSRSNDSRTGGSTKNSGGSSSSSSGTVVGAEPAPLRAVPTLTCDAQASLETEASYSQQSLVCIDDEANVRRAETSRGPAGGAETVAAGSPANAPFLSFGDQLMGAGTSPTLFPAMATIPNIPGVQPIMTRQVSQGWL